MDFDTLRVAFIHPMKAAGTTVNRTVVRHLRRARFQVLSFRKQRDLNRQELEAILNCGDGRLFVHNHAGNWPPDLIRRYRQQGWFLFSFYRHPGDQWCSHYFWTQQPGLVDRSLSKHLNLDEFLRGAWSDGGKYKAAFDNLRNHLDLPENWRELNYVGLYSRQNLRDFMRTYFGKRLWRTRRENASTNRGYDYYLRRGHISKETHQLLLDSQRYQDFLQIRDEPHRVDDRPFYAKSRPIFHDRRPRDREPTRFVVLFQGRAGSSWLIEHLQDHPSVNALEEIFDAIPKKAVCQKTWLNNFFLKMPKANRHVTTLGFKTKLTSIIDRDYFREYLHDHQFRVIHLDRTNPVKLAVSIARASRLRQTTGRSNLYDKSSKLGSINIPPEEFRHCLKRCVEYERLAQYVNTLETSKIRIEYDEAIADPEATLRQVFDFLHVGPVATRCRTIKNTPDDLRLAVSNLDELQRAFPELEEYFV